MGVPLRQHILNLLFAIGDGLRHGRLHLIGLDLALRRPDLIQSLVLINAWSKADPHSGRCFDVRIALLENAGVEAFVKAQPLFLYPAIYMADNPEKMAAEEGHALAHFQGRDNILRRIAALRAFDVDDRLGDVQTPTLVIATRDDLLSVHRVPPQMMGIIPNNTGGFGDIEKASQVFVRNELTALQERLKEVNGWVGEAVVGFRGYELING